MPIKIISKKIVLFRTTFKLYQEYFILKSFRYFSLNIFRLKYLKYLEAG